MQAWIGRARGWMLMDELALGRVVERLGAVAVGGPGGRASGSTQTYASRLLRPYSSNIAAITAP
ncbi:hypothetical protein OKW38_000787 [Paraburkholderia sp. MM5496-R1]|uniref:Uncharacterized protein n=1 Tax=Paraburkholderia tuberum TaxID=157910 RepID=A0A1H1KBX2_9BURK|nr:hypothetical protein [Paraburkholderia sp. HC6.4b]MBB5456010.1 hypothetical protein [Paraburkholderia sp. Kb1A]SDR59295.1 hypothetical protein SAMN05445850_6797 [Paraburkholderia tuberum]